MSKPTLSEPAIAGALEHVAETMRGRKTVVLTGAGISTESGIPDYRGPETRNRARNPVRYNAFMGDAEARQRYWARSAVGWTRFSAAEPNAGHQALAELEQAGFLSGIITQNVDGLHQAAGSRTVVELHGSLSDVTCLTCGRRESRAGLQRRIARLNPGWTSQAAELAPDGDAELPAELTRRFRAPGCRRCEGPIKPDVVFFGESVPARCVDAAWSIYDDADVLLVAGSSLTVFSGYRFVVRARREGKPIFILNLGPTRGDKDATVRVDAPLGESLPALVQRIRG
ncbi:MAG: NAD-dependent protein deacetylase [Bacteroidota bacterium]